MDDAVRYVRFAALGDSVTHGIGDRAAGRCRGWVRLLTDAIAHDHHLSLCNLARPGATVSDMLATQLDAALDHRPDVASLVVGLNDTMRSGWDPARLRSDLLLAADLLVAQGAVLLTVRFHDHTRVFGLPALVARPMRRRIADLNAIYDELHETYGGIRVDLSAHPGVYDRQFWSVDRLHPSELGHRALAHEFADLLAQHGLRFEPPALELDGDPITLLGDLRVIAAEAVPWLGRRVRDLGPELLRLAVRNVRPGLRPTPGPGRVPTLPTAG